MKTHLSILLVLATFATGACTRSPYWREGEWQGSGVSPLPADLLKTTTKSRLANKEVELLEQQVSGVPVEGSFAKQITAEGAQKHVYFRYVPTEHLPKPADVQELLDQKDLTIRLAKKKRFEVLACDNSESTLAGIQPTIHWDGADWELAFKGSCESRLGVPHEYWLSTQGTILDIERVGSNFTNSSERVEVTAQLYPRGPKNSQLGAVKLSLSAVPNYLVNSQLDAVSDAGIKLTDLSQVADIGPQDLKFDLIQAYFFASEAIRWTQRQLSFQPQPLKIRTHVGYPEKTNAAFYYNREVRLGVGDDKAFSHLSWDPSIVVHECMHGVVESLARLPYRGEGGSLNEALSDSLTALYLDNPRIGESAYQAGPYQRNLEGFHSYAEKAGGLYADSLILSSAIWEIRQKEGVAASLSLVSHLLGQFIPSSDFSHAQRLTQEWSVKNKTLYPQVDEILLSRGWL
ncbi:MAG: hypothetical protein AB7N80_10195 [Bdellovibrionales bacterium]